MFLHDQWVEVCSPFQDTEIVSRKGDDCYSDLTSVFITIVFKFIWMKSGVFPTIAHLAAKSGDSEPVYVGREVFL